MDFCPKCNLVVAPFADKKIVGNVVFHKACWDSFSNWTQAQIVNAQGSKGVISVSHAGNRPAQ